MNRRNSKKLRLQQKRFMEELIGETEQAVARMLFKMTRDRTLVEDVLIATWTTACQKIDVLEKHENPHGWIMRAAKFHMLRELENVSIFIVMKCLYWKNWKFIWNKKLRMNWNYRKL